MRGSRVPGTLGFRRVGQVFKVHENPKWRKWGEIMEGEKTDPKFQ